MSRVLPILFNTEMVRAILDGRKTVTRRLIKSQQLIGILPDKCKNGMPEEFLKEKKFMFKPYCDMADAELIKTAYNPPYQPGDILYVRESVFQGVGHYLDVSGETVSVLTNDFEYYADGLNEKDHWKDKYERTWMHRRPSIHMPKEAARIWLKVKDVRVERLQEITVDGIRREGVGVDPKDCAGKFSYIAELFFLFQRLWDSTIKKTDIDRYGWDVSPWVWVIEFERCKKPECI